MPVRPHAGSMAVRRLDGTSEAKAATVELGPRASRAIVMENCGTANRRAWWIVSSAVLAASGVRGA